ncbi:MAG: hypothetical protein J6H18_06075 [Lachnospiraceae bacterium]|nr:hypothetical protein [Lachnospiraceae bacterium]
MGLNLEKDGNGALTASILGQNQSYPITWTVEGNALKLTAGDGDVLGLDYKLSGKTLTLEHEGMVLTFEKE